MKYPTTADRLAVHRRATECKVLVPVPEREIASGESEAVLTTEAVPLMLPVIAGLNETLKLMLCPGNKVTGNAGAVMLKLLEFTPIRESVTLVLPALVSVTFCALVVSRRRVPKFNEVSLAESLLIEAVPVPLMKIGVGEFGALL